MKSSAKVSLVLGVLLCAETHAQIAPISATPNWNRAMPNGPDSRVKITGGICEARGPRRLFLDLANGEYV
jgi:hypothetical protein